MTDEDKDALEHVTNAYNQLVSQIGVPANYNLGTDNIFLSRFLSKVTVEELRKVIELANCYADLCE